MTVQPKKAGLDGMAWVLPLTLAIAIAGCGGGGGGDSGEAPPPMAAGPTPLVIAEAPPACADAITCQRVTGVLLDNDGAASIFWQSAGAGAPSLWRAAVHAAGATATSPTVDIPLTTSGWKAMPIALGNKRIAVVEFDNTSWTSAVVDTSAPAGPTVTPRVALPVGATAQFVSTLHDGAFVVGPTVQRAALDMGGGATAQGMPVVLPAGYSNLWWGRFEPLWGAASSWWVFNSAGNGSTDQRLHLGLVDLGSGEVRDTQDRMAMAWSPNYANTYHCEPVEGPLVDVNDYGQRRALVGWIQRKATANRGCDILADGATLTAASASAAGRPVLGGSAAGPLVLWEEYDLGATAQNNGPFRVVWRARDGATGNWGAATRLSTHPVSRLNGQTSAPDGLLAIAWEGCEDNSGARCTGYLSKYVRGTWTTVDLGARSPTSPFATLLAINIHGDAIAVWSRSRADGCRQNLSAACARIHSYRF